LIAIMKNAVTMAVIVSLANVRKDHSETEFAKLPALVSLANGTVVIALKKESLSHVAATKTKLEMVNVILTALLQNARAISEIAVLVLRSVLVISKVTGHVIQPVTTLPVASMVLIANALLDAVTHG